MKHLKKFEAEETYLDMLAKQTKLRQDTDRVLDNGIDKKREEISKEYSKDKSKESFDKKMDKVLDERRDLTHQVIQCLVSSELGKDDFIDFKDRLKSLLSEYPLDKLPRSGNSIYNKI